LIGRDTALSCFDLKPYCACAQEINLILHTLVAETNESKCNDITSRHHITARGRGRTHVTGTKLG